MNTVAHSVLLRVCRPTLRRKRRAIGPKKKIEKKKSMNKFDEGVGPSSRLTNLQVWFH